MSNVRQLYIPVGLQEPYEGNKEIVTTEGALVLKTGTVNSDNILEIKNTSNSVVSYITGNGDSKYKSIILQSLTTVEINALTPVIGKVVYNSTLNTICFYNGTQWRKVSDSTM